MGEGTVMLPPCVLKHAPPPVWAGARSLFVRFVPSSSMSRSAQPQEPRRTIVKTTARGRPPVISLRKVLSATRHAMPPRLPRRETHLGQPPCRAQRPSPAVKTIRQQRPRPKTRAPAHTGGGAFPVCPFRSFLQHEPQRAIAKANAARSPKQQRTAVRPSHRCAKSCQPHNAPRRPACRAAKNAWASRHAGRTVPAPPRK